MQDIKKIRSKIKKKKKEPVDRGKQSYDEYGDKKNQKIESFSIKEQPKSEDSSVILGIFLFKNWKNTSWTSWKYPELHVIALIHTP